MQKKWRQEMLECNAAAAHAVLVDDGISMKVEALETHLFKESVETRR